jgi:predicted secreted protein
VRNRLMAALVAALASAGCGDEAVTVTETDADRSVMLRVGQQLVVRLGSNPSTGYDWSFGMSPEGILALDSSGFESGGSQPGSGGTQTYRLRARRSGQTTIELTLQRPPDPPVRTIRYVVLVE